MTTETGVNDYRFVPPAPYTGRYSIKKYNGEYGIVRDPNGEYTTWAEAKKAHTSMFPSSSPRTAEQEMAHQELVHGIPSEKGLATLPAKFVAMKQAEEIENGSEEL